jgi:microcin C transport system substrate-binding protein
VLLALGSIPNSNDKVWFFMRFLLLVILFSVSHFSIATEPASNITSQHGIAMHGDLKYDADFTHFNYANPDAPKGGTLRRSVRANSFDSFNPFIVKGVSAAGAGMLYQSLTAHSEDEAFSEYGLIAKNIILPSDRSWVSFELNPNAKFSDGHAITANDVKYSFEMLTTHERAQPFYGAYYGDVNEVVIESDLKVTFKFKNNKNKELPLILGQMPILAKHYWEKSGFERASLDIPVGNGPYTIKSFKPGRSITYARNPDYWGRDLPVNKGLYNFDELTFEYYSDNTVALEAFKAGEYDFRAESSARNWANAYSGKLFDSGTLIKQEVEHQRPAGMQAFVLNSRQEKLSDARVREALSYAFDFEWTNQNLFYDQYKRNSSYFENSELASRDLPHGEELAILETYQDRLPEKLFTSPFTVPSTAKPSSMRKNLRHAMQLLEDAGWSVKNTARVNAKGEQLNLEFLVFQKDFERVIQPFIKNLERLGIQANITVIDTTQYINRLRSFDFDVVVTGFGQSNSPGNEQREYWHSSKVNQEGSRNYAGVNDPVVDELVELIISAPNRDSLVQRTRALDRVLLWGHYVIPNWFNPVDRIAYRNTLARPDETPKSGVFVDSWWTKNAK